MKFSKTDFLTAPHNTIELDLWLEEPVENRLVNTDVKAVENCHIEGSLYYDGKDLVSSDLHLSGTMIILDSITNEDLAYDFEAGSERLYSFAQTVTKDEDLDIIYVDRETIELIDEILEAIVYAAPASYTILDQEDYPKGDGWELVREEDLEAEEVEDPRWAKLKEFQFED